MVKTNKNQKKILQTPYKNYNYMRIFNYETQNGSRHRSKAESGLSKLAYFQQSGICKKKNWSEAWLTLLDRVALTEF